MAKSEKLYNDSPSVKRDKEGKVGVKRPSEADKEDMGLQDGAGGDSHGMNVNVNQENHPHERREVHQKHVKEHMDMHHRHEMEHSAHKDGDKTELHSKHEKEHEDMHTRHLDEIKQMHARQGSAKEV